MPVSTTPRRAPDTAARILDVAERLAQVRGYNGFSYADVAAELRITRASLHYHFAGKSELGAALVSRYTARFAQSLAEIDARGLDAPGMLAAFVTIYAEVLSGGRVCLCGILAAEYETLPAPLRAAVTRFFDDTGTWLARVLERGRAEGALTFSGDPADAADAILGGLEGAMLLARTRADLARFGAAAHALLRCVGA